MKLSDLPKWLKTVFPKHQIIRFYIFFGSLKKRDCAIFSGCIGIGVDELSTILISSSLIIFTFHGYIVELGYPHLSQGNHVFLADLHRTNLLRCSEAPTTCGPSLFRKVYLSVQMTLVGLIWTALANMIISSSSEFSSQIYMWHTCKEL